MVQIQHALALAGALGLSRARLEMPGVYMAELEDGASPQQLVRELSAANMTISIRQSIDSKLFRGVSFSVDEAQDARGGAAGAILAAAGAARQVWPVRAVTGPEVVAEGFVGLDDTSNVLRRDAGDSYYPHVMTQIDLLHKAGFTGQGIRIGVVDTGVDYLNPILGGCFGPGCIVVQGWDAVGLASLFSPNGTLLAPEPDNDPMDCFGHGTHVAGIISALPNEFGFIGAAPGARLGAYRSMDCNGFGTEETIVAGMLRAFDDGNDIITMSIGLGGGIPDSVMSLTATRIIEAGVPVFVAIGNDGLSGTMFYAVSPAEGRRVSAISSYDTVEYPAVFALAEYTVGNGEPHEFGWTPLLQGTYNFTSGADAETLPLINLNGFVVDNATVNGCAPIPDSVPDLSGYLVLVSMDIPEGCYLFTQRQNIMAKGGALMMFWGTELQISTIVNDDPSAFIATTTPPPAEEWIEALAGGQNVTVNMTVPWKAAPRVVWSRNEATGGRVSNYTTWGPTYDLTTGPTFGGPGRGIMSTYIQNGQGVVVLSGTSMAAPIVAASAALLSQARNTSDPMTLQSLLASTAAQPRGLQSPLQAGAGLVQLWDAAQAKGVLSVSAISFNDSDHHPGEVTFTLHNTGGSDAVYELGHAAVSTVYALTGEGRLATAPFEAVDAYADVTFAAGQALVRAGAKANITVRCTPPGAVDKARWPIYSGYVTLGSANGDALSVPYVGNAGSMRDGVIIDNTTVTFYPRLTAEGVVSLPRPTAPGNTSYEDLKMNANPYLPTRVLRFDLVEPPPAGPPSNSSGALPSGRWLGRRTYGQAWGSPSSVFSTPGGGVSLPFGGFLASGELLQAGRYAVLASALRLLADPASDDEADWEVVETAPFLLQYQG